MNYSSLLFGKVIGEYCSKSPGFWQKMHLMNNEMWLWAHQDKQLSEEESILPIEGTSVCVFKNSSPCTRSPFLSVPVSAGFLPEATYSGRAEDNGLRAPSPKQWLHLKWKVFLQVSCYRNQLKVWLLISYLEVLNFSQENVIGELWALVDNLNVLTMRSIQIIHKIQGLKRNLKFSSAPQALRNEEKFKYLSALAWSPNSIYPALLLSVNDNSLDIH